MREPAGRTCGAGRPVTASAMPVAATVLIAAYGRLPLLRQSVASALAQDHPNFEVLVVDDGSDEATRDWLRSAEAQESRLRVVFRPHQGVAAARANGVAAARSELICILDSDDVLLPHALSRLCAVFEADDDAVLAYTRIRELRPDGAAVVQAYPEFTTARAMLWATLLKPRLPFKHSGTMFRRRTALELGSYDPGLPCKVDIDLYLKFLRAGHRPRLVAEPLVDFRMHKNSVSRNRWLGIRVWFRLIDRYGPQNSGLRLGIKVLRGVSEMLKSVYIELKA